MVAVYAIASLTTALAAGVFLFPAIGGWSIAVAWIAANAACAGIAAARAAGRRRREAASTDRMVADLRSVLAAAHQHDATTAVAAEGERRVA